MGTAWNVARAASALLDAEQGRFDRTPLSEEWPELELQTAYAVQDETLRRRLDRGETLTGLKLGLTSRAKQQRMGVDQPIVAWLTDAMVVSDGRIAVDRFIHPRAEPEIALVMAHRLRGPGVTAEQALAAVGSVAGGIEVIDSRYQDYRFTLQDVVADNASSAAYVLGDVRLPPGYLDLAAERCTLEVDGAAVDRATGEAVLGHPAKALALAANVLAERDLALEPGWLVLTGGLTDAVPVSSSTRVVARFSRLGDVPLRGA